MGYIVIDTEGTGLFTHKNPDGTTKPSDDPGQPRMAEFAAVLCDDDFNIEGTYQQYVLPVGWQNEDGTPMLEMPQRPFEVHGLSMDFLREQGRPVELGLAVYSNAIKKGRVLLGFNQQHDGRQVRAELRHAGWPDLFEETPNICAMRSLSTGAAKAALGKIPKLNGKGGFLGLVDAAAFFNVPFAQERRHTALEDVIATVGVARELHVRGLLLPAEVHYAKDHSSRKVTPGREKEPS